MPSNVGSTVFFVRWKANFLSCQGANKNQMHAVTLHHSAGLSVGGSKRGTERQTRIVTETGRHEGEVQRWPTWGSLFLFFFSLPRNELGRESLCIGLINSYLSSAWHPGNRSGFALGLIFRPVEDSQFIRALFRLHTPNFPDLPKKKWGVMKRGKERVIEEGIDDKEGEMEGR